MASVSEFAAIEVLRRGLSAGPTSSRIRVGIGDDAAVLGCPTGELVCSIDASLEGVHFDTKWLSLENAARRAVHAAVSDLAAMAATPLAAVVALEVPSGLSRREFSAIAKGQVRAANETSCPVVGGNITRGDKLAFTTTVLGSCERGASVLRSTAVAGDEIWLSDEVGWAGLGLSMLQAQRLVFTGRGYRAASRVNAVAREGTAARTSGSLRGQTAKRARGGTDRRSRADAAERVGIEAVWRWVLPSAKVSVGRAWRGAARAMIDVSDSLASEARHLAEASSVKLVLDGAALRAAHPGLWAAAETLGVDPWPLVLYGGEDYALLATGAAKRRPAGAKVIGKVERGSGAWLSHARKLTALNSGFDHLRHD